jgi:hypothetical protein
MSDETSELKEINEKLDRILKLMIQQQFDEDETIQDKIRFLLRMGFNDNQELADIIGTTKGTVKTEKSKVKNG